jgi:hypothetical protein
VEAMKQQQKLESHMKKSQYASLDVQSQRQTEQNVSSRVLMKRHELESLEGSGEELNKNKKLKAQQESSLDFESSSFIGRSMLANLGWKEGSGLGKSGGSSKAQTLIEVTQKTNTSGLGSSGSSSSISSKKSSVDIRGKTQSRYDQIVKDNANVKR